jgi:hypothetical protein
MDQTTRSWKPGTKPTARTEAITERLIEIGNAWPRVAYDNTDLHEAQV